MTAKITLLLGGARSGKSTLAEKIAIKRQTAGNNIIYAATLLPNDDEMKERIRQHRTSRPANWRTVETPYQLQPALIPHLNRGDTVLLDCLTTWSANLLLREISNSEDVLENQTSYSEIYEDALPANANASAGRIPLRGGTAPLETDREENVTSELQEEIHSDYKSTNVLTPDYSPLERLMLAELEGLIKNMRERDVNLVIVTNEVGMSLVPPYPLGRVYRDMLGRLNQRVAALADEVLLVVAGLAVDIKKLAEATFSD